MSRRTPKPKTDRSVSTATSASSQSLDNDAKKNQKKTVIFDDNIINAYLEAGGKSLSCNSNNLLDSKLDLKIKNSNGDSLIHIGKSEIHF